tara:strand:+ start:3190 stop:3408 length:219 start_codon:yes stop_codon:yes gene_type:complete
VHTKEEITFNIGSLIRIKIRMQLSRDDIIREGDYGIIISEDMLEDPLRFDYLVVVHGIECFVFKNEIELVSL